MFCGAQSRIIPNSVPSIKNNCKADEHLNDGASLETPSTFAGGIRLEDLDTDLDGGL